MEINILKSKHWTILNTDPSAKDTILEIYDASPSPLRPAGHSTPTQIHPQQTPAAATHRKQIYEQYHRAIHKPRKLYRYEYPLFIGHHNPNIEYINYFIMVK